MVIIIVKIGLKYAKIWGKSYKIVRGLLEDYGYFAENPKLLLNFGGNHEEVDSMVVLNKRISHIYDKVKMNRLFDKFNIPHPKTFYYPFTDLPLTDDECVIKNRLGSRGNGISFTTFNQINLEELNSDKYVQYYIPFENEYRVVKFIYEYKSRLKIPNENGVRIKNGRSCRYKNIRNEPLEIFAKNVCDKFKIDFTGLDIGEYNGYYFMIEVNSACGLNKNSAPDLVRNLIRYYQNNIRDD